MALAILANDLCSLAIGIHVTGDGAGDFIVEAGPTTAAVEFVC